MNSQSAPQSNSRWFIGLLLALALFAAFFELGRADVVTDNEGQRATPPAEMVRSGHYTIPTINGKDYLAKPPLLYWTIAGIYSVTGTISPFMARIPSALCFTALVLCVYAYTRRCAGTRAAQWAALATLASPYILQRSRVAELDIPLTLATFLSVVAYRAASREANPRSRTLLFTLLSGLALGAAIMLKGPAPFLFLIPAWLALLALSGDDDTAWIRSGIRWTLIAMLLGLIIWALSLVAPFLVRWIRFPVALTIMVLAWVVIAWRRAPTASRWRLTAILLATLAVGCCVAAPWCAAVINEKGWDFAMRLIRSESLERTHTATNINSGSPLYYILALPGMLAPWGFLLVFQFSKTLWNRAIPFYRFTVLSSWTSTLVFSLIAGKEYEYILPAIPLMLAATGCLLADYVADALEPTLQRWTARWRDVFLALLTVAAVGFFVYVLIKQRNITLIAESAVFLLVAVGWSRYGWRNPANRLFALFAVTLCVWMMWLLVQSYKDTGKRSPQTIARITGELLRAGHDVEAVKMTSAFDVYPGFAFYAGTPVPTVTDADHVRRKLEGPTPYYCVIRVQQLEQANMPLRQDLMRPLLGPFTSKKLVMIGNRPLPELPGIVE